MVDIVGYLKVNEELPERVRYLLTCIRGYQPLQHIGSKFILALQSPSEWLYNLVESELKKAGWDYKLYRIEKHEATMYGFHYSNLLFQCENGYVLNFIEDHFLMIDSIKMKYLLDEMESQSADVMKSTFHQLEIQTTVPDLGKLAWEDDEGYYFLNDNNAYNALQQRWPRFFIGVNFITTLQFAIKFWGRSIDTLRPHEYELSNWEKGFEHVAMIPKVEVLASIDDDHGINHSCLLHRNKEATGLFHIHLESVRPEEYFKMENTINLFHINNYEVKTEALGNLLHGNIVKTFERNFCDYVGAKYGCSFNSATSAIFLIFKELFDPEDTEVIIPSMIPAVVPNAIIQAGCDVAFSDNYQWIGGSYDMKIKSHFRVIDSAQEVNRGQYSAYHGSDDDLMIFSHYPTKPVGSADGGMVVSNNKDVIEALRALSLNGMQFAENNWDRKQIYIGHKMYMNSMQAYIANENLKKLDDKRKVLERIRDKYNEVFGANNDSDHLYRIHVPQRAEFLKEMKLSSIVCGIHYEAQHLNPLFQSCRKVDTMMFTDREHKSTVSLPFHEMLTDAEVDYVIGAVQRFLKKYIQ